MRISMVMCTRNRAVELARVLATAAAMRVPEGLSWEMLIVDNGSSDDTAAVVASFTDRLPIRRVFEPVAGLSNARNRGVAEAQGEYICWTDDDVVIDPEWLAAYAEAIDQHPGAAFFGGVVTPTLNGPVPDWFSRNHDQLRYLMAERTYADPPVPLTAQSKVLPFGANYAVRTAEQRRHLYDPALGVAPGRRRLGEETAVIEAIIASGGTGMSVPRARVLHLIAPERRTLAYVGVYEQSVGETYAHAAVADGDHVLARQLAEGSTPMGVPIWIWRKSAASILMFFLTRFLAPSATWLAHWRVHHFLRGMIRYLRAMPAASTRLPAAGRPLHQSPAMAGMQLSGLQAEEKR